MNTRRTQIWKEIKARWHNYPVEAWLFILLAPAFRWQDLSYLICNPDIDTLVRYIIDVFLCVFILEIVTNSKYKS